MEATTAAAASESTFAQKGIVVLATAYLAWSLAGFVAEPSFATGTDAPTAKVLGVDFNGWHALSGVLLFAPAYFFALHPRSALFYSVYAGAALVLTAIWVLLSTEPLFVLHLPNNEADAVFHFITGGTFLFVAAVQIRRDRAGA